MVRTERDKVEAIKRIFHSFISLFIHMYGGPSGGRGGGGCDGSARGALGNRPR
jgi:hypothetical protein